MIRSEAKREGGDQVRERLIDDVGGSPRRSAEGYGPIIVGTAGAFWGRRTQRETEGKAWETLITNTEER